MYPIAMYSPVRHLDDPTARVRTGRRAGGEDRAASPRCPIGAGGPGGPSGPCGPGPGTAAGPSAGPA